MKLLNQIEEYWSGRAKGYSQVNQQELATEQKEKWWENLREYLPKGKPEDIKILDVGTGPGFFAILLAQKGYQVTAVDYTEEMLREAQANAGAFKDKIVWLRRTLLTLWFPEI